MNILRIVFLLFIYTVTTNAHPVIWKYGTATMVKDAPSITDVMVHYSLEYNWSLGFTYKRFKQLDKDYVIGQSNWLLSRWNKAGSQGNMYLLSGIGFSTQHSNDIPIFHLGGQADWETRRAYTLVRSEYYEGAVSALLSRVRIGIAPYIGGFNDVNMWLIAQIDYLIIEGRHMKDIMPVIRLFKDNILVEIGSNFSDKSMVAVMIHF